MKQLVIFGAGKVAEVIVDAVLQHPDYQIVAICVDAEFMTDSREFLTIPMYTLNELPSLFPPESVEVLIAVGYHYSNQLRADKMAALQALGYHGARFIAQNASVSSRAQIGEFSIILPHATVQAGAIVAENVIVWDHGFVGHHASVAAHCWINTGVVICGNAEIGEYCYFGVNASVAHNVQVGHHCFIGANALINQHAADQGVYIQPGTERYRLDSPRFWAFSKNL